MIPSGFMMISSVSGELPAFISGVEMMKVWKFVVYIGRVGGLDNRMSVDSPVRLHEVEVKVDPGWANDNRKQADQKVRKTLKRVTLLNCHTTVTLNIGHMCD